MYLSKVLAVNVAMFDLSECFYQRKYIFFVLEQGKRHIQTNLFRI